MCHRPRSAKPLSSAIFQPMTRICNLMLYSAGAHLLRFAGSCQICATVGTVNWGFLRSEFQLRGSKVLGWAAKNYY